MTAVSKREMRLIGALRSIAQTRGAHVLDLTEQVREFAAQALTLAGYPPPDLGQVGASITISHSKDGKR